MHALRGVDLDVYPGEITMLVGPSGCGKTTLLSVVAGILRPTSGSVVALGTELTKLSSWRRTAFRRENVGFVFQQFNLLPALTAAENAAVPLVIQGYSKRAALAHANELLDKMGMGERVNNLPGQAFRRPAAARGDRPGAGSSPAFAGLRRADVGARCQDGPHDFGTASRSIAIEGDRAVIIVTHDSRIFEFADTLARMDDGHIVSMERQATRRPRTDCVEIRRFDFSR